MRRVPRKRGERGVTLVELLVAVVITTIIMFAMTTIFQAVIKLWVQGAAAIEMSQNARIALIRMMEEIQTALPPIDEAPSGFIGVNNTAAAMTDSVADEIHYFGMRYNTNEASTPTERAGEITRQGFWLKHPAGGDRRIQWRTVSGDIVDGTGADSMPDGADKLLQVAGEGGDPFAYFVSDLDVWYYDAATDKWYQEWDTRPGGVTAGSYDDNRMPDRVRITITMRDPDGNVPDRKYSIVFAPGTSASVSSFLQEV